MIMFCKTCGTLLSPTLTPSDQIPNENDTEININKEENTEELRMVCPHCATSTSADSNTLSFTNYVHREIPSSRQEIFDISSDPTLCVIDSDTLPSTSTAGGGSLPESKDTNKTENKDSTCCDKREIVYLELPAPSSNAGLGVRYVCRECLQDAVV